MAAALTRGELQRVATHVLARARYRATGKFGLRVTPGGIGTPAYGSGIEVVRMAGTVLVHEHDASVRYLELQGSSLAAAAAFVGVDLAEPFSCGEDTPPLGAVDEALTLDAAEVAVFHAWWSFGCQVLDTLCSEYTDPVAIQLWPEHFDAGTSVQVAPGAAARCNLGVSPGDAFSPEPYLYVGPWTADRPGPSTLWNAPFGAALLRSALTTKTPDAALAQAHAFLRLRLNALAPTA
jgi:hypothetical protein